MGAAQRVDGTIADLAWDMPEKPAVIMSDGPVLTYRQLEARANQAAHLFRAHGVMPGEAVALCLENGLEFFEAAVGCLRSGLVVVPVSSRLTASEVEYIVRDSEARALLTSPAIGEAFAALPGLLPDVVRFAAAVEGPGYLRWATALAAQPTTRPEDERPGTEMLYSSGTTGRPKGIRLNPDEDWGAKALAMMESFRLFGMTAGDRYLSPAPLYHSAPYFSCMATLRLGGTVVCMKRFDALEALALIERHRVTFSQWVPTHFVRMLKLPDETRLGHDLSSHRIALHAAAPCPPAVKRAMIDWWGPILLEYFGSTEQGSITMIDSQDWLAHPGSVGRGAGIHICDDAGEPLPAGEVGLIYSEGGRPVQYHNDAGKSRRALNRHGWMTVGDVGRLDADGYLYLSDRRDFMIISGGVNVYPQEIESVCINHPDVVDVAVLGLPDDDLGEVVVAVVQPRDMAHATPEAAEALRSYMRQFLSGVKTPKLILFRADLPRLPTGKLQKFRLREDLLRERAATP
ncbi:AMP-binding protein [Zavarzinia sp. CC-PAN008]|uniref:AMP-binding protein n=1 Tax=Zavarzinia sp. CC-PAN008 TaxID=3243332 RepID=UPI003F744430